MECRYACELLCAYLDGELDPGRVSIVEEHLHSCNSCKRELKTQEIVKSLVQKRFCNIFAPDSLKRRVMLELEKAEEYRESGVQVLDLVRWGTHVAQLYNTKSDLTELLVPYIGMGLEQNELCVWVILEISEEEAREVLAAEIPGIPKYIDRRQLQILSYKDWYLPGGRFDAECTLKNGLQKYQEALSGGYSGFRVTGSSGWLEQSAWPSFMEYENRVNGALNNHRILILCSYKENKCTKDNIFDVFNTHRYVIVKTEDFWTLKKSAETYNLPGDLCI